MEPYSHHVLMCTGDFCSPDRRGRQIYSLLAELLQREDMLFGPKRVKRGETPCLGVCSNGPIVVVYPEGIGTPRSRRHYWSESSSSTSRTANRSKRRSFTASSSCLNFHRNRYPSQ